ncbi:unnamed protein product [Brachionus calyciflorus]|uniref:Uncharacterized protein n=1 Tax=Brachionus calyciflorus TaxID=104777 RepID=A0A814DEP0_9BILA|nr:unnamed protein product [Brachionus calyciflorus]
MEKTKQAEERIKDREVVLLIGRTGSGKSTDLHCLAGSKFYMTESQNHYEPYDLPNDLLLHVRISASANSETRYIFPFEVDVKTLINKNGSIFLCDTPFNDTAVAYIYTKFPSVESITNALNEALNKDDLNETISEIIESMLEENPILIDPLNPESAKTALKRIVKLTRIEYPNEIFKNITNSKAYDCLIKQVNLHERTID